MHLSSRVSLSTGHIDVCSVLTDGVVVIGIGERDMLEFIKEPIIIAPFYKSASQGIQSRGLRLLYH